MMFAKKQFYSHELNRKVHLRVPGDIVTMMALHGWNAFGIYEVVQEEMARERIEKKEAARRLEQKPLDRGNDAK
jgi:hypothetical protein